jgi:hypothetical protein
LIKTTSCNEVKGREIVSERDQERNIRSILRGGVILFPMMLKDIKRKIRRVRVKHMKSEKGLFREGILSGGVTLYYQKRRGTWRQT